MDDVVPGRTPFAAETYLLYERYRRSHMRLRSQYYRVKPFLPRRAQVAARQAAARRQRSAAFPAWPAETALLRLRATALRNLLQTTRRPSFPVVNLWPGKARFAFVLTHDVESRGGMEGIPPLIELERAYGFVSSWNICAEDYPRSVAGLNTVRAVGCEVGLHGIRHDNSLFRHRSAFLHGLPAIACRMEEWGLVGFRSPALWRNAEWTHELPCAYDSSFPDTGPFEGQPGGCCSIHPFFFGDVVELPVTLDQDFTLFELLGETSIDRWTSKGEWIIRRHGLINVIVHPDYMTPARLGHYEALLDFLARQEGGWHALPREVAKWWRRRDRLHCVADDEGSPRIEGVESEEATVAHARVVGDLIAYDL